MSLKELRREIRREGARVTHEVVEVTESLLFLVAWAVLLRRDRRE
jgi:hypothetical protein